MTDWREDPGVDAEDERLLGELGRLVRERDPVPPELVDFARESYTWRTIDAELAELVADSQEASGAALVRSAATGVRLLAFAAGDRRLDLEVLVEGASRSLVGELDPPAAVRVVVEHAGGSLTEDSDELGRFVLGGVPAGLVRLRCRWPSGAPLLTPWVRV